MVGTCRGAKQAVIIGGRMSSAFSIDAEVFPRAKETPTDTV